MADSEAPASAISGKRNWIRMLQPVWNIAIVLLVLVFVWRQKADLTQAMHEIRLADWRWLILIVLSAILAHTFITLTLSTVFLRIGRRIPFIPALATHAEREMIAAVMPFGGAASYVTLVSRFGVYGVTRNDAMLAVMLYSVLGHLSFIAIAIPAMALLIAQHNATAPIQIGAVAVLAIALVVVSLVTAVLRGKSLPASIERRLPSFVNEFREMARSTSLPARALLQPFVFSLLADLFGVLSMWAALHAVHVDAGPIMALVAYTVGTMLLMAAPIFQGLGLVEVSTIYLLERLGVPLSQAIGATFLYRFVDVWLPVVLGIGVHARYQRALRGLPAYLPALWTALSGVMAMGSVLPPTGKFLRAHLQRASGFGMLNEYHAGRIFTLVAGFLLLLLALRLVHWQHTAWVITLVLSCLLTVVYLFRDFDDIGAVISGMNVVILLVYRARFRVRSDIPSLRRGLYILVASFTATYLFGVLSLWLAEKKHFGREFSIASSLRTAGDIYFGLGSGNLVAKTNRGEWILDSMQLLVILSIVISAFAILRPIIWRHTVQRSETQRARKLIEQWGDSSLDRFKYWPDKLQFFAKDDKGVVSFGLSGRVALVLGDPTARDDMAFAETLDEFLDFCQLNGWDPAFHQVPPIHLDVYISRGFNAMLIGREAIVPIDTFTLSGKSMGSLRSVRNRAERTGSLVEYTEPPLPAELVLELKEVSDEWLTLDGRRERTFTLGQFERDYIRESPVLVQRSATGRVEAFVNLIPDGSPGELTFDLMRHRADAPNGSMDLLIMAMIDFGKNHGLTALSLGMVPFANPGTEDSMDTTNRAISQLARPMEHFFASEGLFAYKNKFHPRWEPRYLVVHALTRLPRVAIALARLSEIDDRKLLPHFGRRSHDERRPNPDPEATQENAA